MHVTEDAYMRIYLETIYDIPTSSLAATVNFNQSTYSVYEPDGFVQLVLLLSNPLSSDATIQVFTGEYWLYVSSTLDIIDELFCI